MRVAVIGAGSWGTTAAILVAPTAEVRLWARRPELAEAISASRANPDYLQGEKLPASVTATSSLVEALDGADVIVMAVPSHGFRAVLEEAAPSIARDIPILSLTKGIEADTLLRMTEVVADVLDHDASRVGVLTGPNLADEIVAGQPALAVVAFTDLAVATAVQSLFMGPTFRVYTNPDVIGAESAGALKNVMAIAAGMAHGLGYGDNSKAAIVTRALAELTRLGIAMGGQPMTFAGLAGMGDLVATCFSDRSRNRRVGVGLGEGRTIAEITAEMHMVAEGVRTTQAVLDLAERHAVDMPIATAVGRVLYQGDKPADLVHGLMTREAKTEMHGLQN